MQGQFCGGPIHRHAVVEVAPQRSHRLWPGLNVAEWLHVAPLHGLPDVGVSHDRRQQPEITQGVHARQAERPRGVHRP